MLMNKIKNCYLYFFCFFLSFFPTEMCLFQWHLLKAQFFLLNCFDIPVKKINPFYKNNPVVTSPPSQWAIFYILNMYYTICVHVALIPKIKVSKLCVKSLIFIILFPKWNEMVTDHHENWFTNLSQKIININMIGAGKVAQKLKRHILFFYWK